jgi:hypothetical protein
MDLVTITQDLQQCTACGPVGRQILPGDEDEVRARLLRLLDILQLLHTRGSRHVVACHDQVPGGKMEELRRARATTSLEKPRIRQGGRKWCETTEG